VHEHLGKVGAMRLILGQIQNQLHRPTDPVRVFRYEQCPLPLRHTVRHATPEGQCLVARHRLHEADRCAAVDTIDEHLDQPLEGCVIDRRKPPDRPRRRHRPPSLTFSGKHRTLLGEQRP
jgi:hypothetical protein